MIALVAQPEAPLGVGFATLADPTPRPGELRVRMHAASVNRGEIRYAATRAPGTVLGWDVAGQVEALGPGVTGFSVGQRVVGMVPGQGSFAEQVRLPAAWAAPIAEGCSFELAATLPVAGVTAFHVLKLAQARPGDRVLVTGAAGGVGHFVVQLAAAAGLDVVGQARTSERGTTVLEAGARVVLVHAGDGALLHDRFDAIIDGIGGPMLPALIQAVKPKGRIVVYGNSADAPSTFRVEQLYGKAASLVGFRLFDTLRPEEAMATLTHLTQLVADGRLRVTVSEKVPLEEAPRAIMAMYQRERAGKVVLLGSGVQGA